MTISEAKAVEETDEPENHDRVGKLLEDRGILAGPAAGLFMPPY
jgi:hypothetical protein